MSLRSRIITSLSLTALAFALLSMVLVATQESTLRSDARAASEATAHRLGQQIDRLMAERYREVQMMSRSRSTQAADINRAVAISDMVSVAMFVAANGDVIASNTKDSNGKSIDNSWLRERNFSNRRWFSDAKAGNFTKGSEALSGTVVVGPYNEKAVAEATGGDGLVVAFSTPVLTEAGQMIGVWVNFVPFNRIEHILLAGYDALAARDMEKSELFLLDSRGIVLADITAANHQDYKRDYTVIGKQNLVESGVSTATEAVTNKKSGIAAIRTDKGSQIDAYSYSTGAGDYPGLGWTVLVRTPKGQLYGNANLAANMLYGGILLLLAALIAVVVTQGDKITRYIAGPLHIVKQQADVFEAATGALIAEAVTATQTLRGDSKQLTSQMNDAKRHAARMTERASGTASTLSEIVTMAEAADATLWKLTSQIKKTNSASTEANDASTRSSKSLKALTGRAMQIRDALQSMTAITSQLHLLALNATIESARGETNGISMVAGELKTLAGHTAKATEILTTHLQRFEDTARDVISDVGMLQDAVYEISKAGEGSKEAIDRQQASLTELLRSLKEMSAQSSEIAQTIVTVEMTASEGAAVSERTHAAAATLREQLAGVKEKLDSFFTTIRAA